jgi:arginase family enzyme
MFETSFETLYHSIQAGLLFFDLQSDSPPYLTFDMNCLDLVFAPGISHRDPGRLSPQFLLLLCFLFQHLMKTEGRTVK